MITRAPRGTGFGRERVAQIVAIITKVSNWRTRDDRAWPDVRWRVQRRLRSSEQEERTWPGAGTEGFLEDQGSAWWGWAEKPGAVWQAGVWLGTRCGGAGRGGPLCVREPERPRQLALGPSRVCTGSLQAEGLQCRGEASRTQGASKGFREKAALGVRKVARLICGDVWAVAEPGEA